MKRLALIPLFLFSLNAAAACTIEANESIVEFTDVQINTVPDDTEITVSYDIICPEGVNYQLYPRATSISLALTSGGSSNGSVYMLFERLDGTQIKTTIASSFITGTGTGAPETVFLKLFLSRSSSTPTLAVDKLGSFSTSAQLMRVKRLDNNATTDSVAQQVSGEIVGSCLISAVSDVDFGTISRKPTEQIIDQVANLSVNCTSGVNYLIYADEEVSQNTWISGGVRPISGYDRLNVYYTIAPDGNTVYQNISNTLARSYTGTGAQQDYNIRVRLAAASNAVGDFSHVVRPRIKF